MDKLTLKEVYEIIEDYVVYAGINFDLFTFSQHPTLNMLVFLLNEILDSLQSKILSFKPNQNVASQLNQLFQIFLMDFCVTRTEVLRIDQDPVKILRPLACLIRDRFKPLYTTIISHKYNEECKKEPDIDANDLVPSIVKNLQNDPQHALKFDDFKQIVQVGIKDFESALFLERQTREAMLDQEIVKMRTEIDRLEKETAEDQEFIQSSDGMFRDDVKFRQSIQDLEDQQKKLLETYNATIQLYKKTLLKNVWKEPREYLQKLRSEFPNLDGFPNRGSQLIELLLKHMDQLENNPEMINEENQSKMIDWIHQTNSLIKNDNRMLEQKLKDASQLLESKRKNFPKNASAHIRASADTEPSESNEDLQKLEAEISTLSRLEKEADVAYQKLQEEILNEKSQHDNQMSSLKQEVERLKQELIKNVQESSVPPPEEFLNELQSLGIDNGWISATIKNHHQKPKSRKKKK